ncbi:MAG: PQQ-binding-like beta-propeller repeat protein [bacterium]|nr:PQQ-binding-like beta-propeller repeat protein [bacterium]
MSRTTTHPADQWAEQRASNAGSLRWVFVMYALGFIWLAGSKTAYAQGLRVSAEELDDPDTLPFQIYDTMQVRALHESILEHLEAGRLPEALEQLQEMLENHRGEVLPSLYTEAPANRGNVPSVVHVGSSGWANDKLFEVAGLNPEARSTYRRMFEKQAQAALELAMLQGKRSDWVEVARRWPITKAANRARWALGDLAMEAGRWDLGRSSWARAMACELGTPHAIPQTSAQWESGLKALAELGSTETKEHLVNIESRVAWLLESGNGLLVEAPLNKATPLQPGRAAVGALDQYEAGWPEALELPRHPMIFDWGFQMHSDTDGDRLFVNTSRQLLALGVWTGEIQWSSPLEMAGWTQGEDQDARFKEAMDFQRVLFAPAVAEGIVVASFQLPFVLTPPDQFRQMRIICLVPERRLFAFDAKTGKPLWDTAPPTDWDGESGPTRERVSIAGPPVIDRSKIVVPTVHLRGRVEFHVDCFDLETGEALWHTPLVTGQRELNMFGREISEFTAPPVRIEGDRVLVATQLGSVVCLDLETGATLWQSLYPQIEITKATYYSPGYMRSLWTNSPPVVVDDLVLVAPCDGDSLLALDLNDGTVRWSMEHKDFRNQRSGVRSRSEFNYLVDADENNVILGGRRVASFSPNIGTLADGPPRHLVWVYPTGESISNPGLRAVSTSGQILVPTDGALVGVDRRNGRPRRSLDWTGHKGSPLVTAMGVFTVGCREVFHFLNWKENLTRAQRTLDEKPGDEEALYNLALLLQKRGQAARLAQPEPRLAEARRSIAKARELLSDALSKEPTQSSTRLRELLFDTLLEEGRARRMSASPAGARQAWERALAMAEGDREVSTALLMLISLDRGRDEVRMRQRLHRLSAEFPHLSVPCRLLRPGTSDDDPASTARWIPTVATTRSDPLQAGKPTRLPLGLWARMEYADSVLGERARKSVTSPYPALYYIVKHFSSWDWIEGGAGQAAAARIQMALERGFETGFDEIEARAEMVLQKALASGDRSQLEEVQRFFPFTSQAERAGEERIRWAAQTGQIALLAQVVLRDFPAEFSLERCTPTQREHLALLALKIGEQGGLTFRAELGKRLSASAPRQTMDLDMGDPLSMQDLSLRWSAQVPVPRTPSLPTFPSKMQSVNNRSPLIAGEGLWIPPYLTDNDASSTQPTPSVTLHLWNDALSPYPIVAAFGDGDTPLWTLPEAYDRQSPERWAASPGRAHVATPSTLLTADRDTGTELWRWEADDEQFIDQVLHSQGVLVVTAIDISSENDTPSDFIQIGLEASSGTELWRRRVRSSSFHHHTVIGSGFQVLISKGTHPSQVFDLFSGSTGPTIQTGRLSSVTLRASWIEDGKWILPTFASLAVPSKNHIEAYDMASGSRAWRVPFGPGRELWRVLQFRGDTYLEIYRSPAEGPRSMAVHELDVRKGNIANRSRFGLPEGGLLIGLPKRATIQLQSPWVFARITLATGNALRALHLRNGQRWERTISSNLYMVRPESLPRPMVSEDAVAVALPKRGSRGQPDLTTYYILTFTKDHGRATSDLMIRERGPKNAPPQLSAIGPWLVFGKGTASQILGASTR